MKEVHDLLNYERKLFDQGMTLIAGVDEVGRGPLAGPFVATAVILDIPTILEKLKLIINDVIDPKINLYSQIKDSKKITPRKREQLSKFIREEAVAYAIVEISVPELDSLGLTKTTQNAFYQSIQKLKIKPQHVLTDSFEIKKITKENQTNINGGDNLSICIASASIIAKVYRDELMVNLHKEYPQYGFDKHKGYGTKLHLENLAKFGPCEIHRKSFDPVKKSKLNLN